MSYTISDDPTRLDLDTVHRYLSEESYWAKGLERDTLERAVAGSLCFGLYDREERAEGQGRTQVGFARVVTDRTTFAWLADVFVLPAHRGQGLSKRLLETILAHPDLQGLRRFMLATRDAHGLYQQFGFMEPAKPQNLMERRPASASPPVSERDAQPKSSSTGADQPGKTPVVNVSPAESVWMASPSWVGR